MEDLLIVKDLYEPIENKDMSVGIIESEWKTLHRKAINTIRQCVDISIIQHVASDTNAFELGHKLYAYTRGNVLNKTFLMRKPALGGKGEKGAQEPALRMGVLLDSYVKLRISYCKYTRK